MAERVVSRRRVVVGTSIVLGVIIPGLVGAAAWTASATRRVVDNWPEVGLELVEVRRPYLEPRHAICSTRGERICTSVDHHEFWHVVMTDPLIVLGVDLPTDGEELILEPSTGRLLDRPELPPNAMPLARDARIRWHDTVIEALGSPMGRVRLFDVESGATTRTLSYRSDGRSSIVELSPTTIRIDSGPYVYALDLPDGDLRPIAPEDATSVCALRSVLVATRGDDLLLADAGGTNWRVFARPGSGRVGHCRELDEYVLVTWTSSSALQAESASPPTVPIEDPHEVLGRGAAAYLVHIASRSYRAGLALPWAITLRIQDCETATEETEPGCRGAMSALASPVSAHLHVDVAHERIVLDDVSERADR